MSEDEKTAIRDVRSLVEEALSAPRKLEAAFIVIAGGTVGQMHKLIKGETFIGRSVEAEIQVDDEGVSRKHAKVSILPDQRVLLADNGSTNGTYLNGSRIQAPAALKDGDKVQVGATTVLKFQYQDALEESFQRKLFDSAVKDGLTGVYNKKYFLDRIETDFSYAKRHKTNLTLLFFDIDHFKQINDKHGHPAGDHVLREVAALLKKSVRNEDVLARFGGEEFVLLMRDVDDAVALMLAERFRRAVEGAAFEFGGTKIPVTVSIGIGTFSEAHLPKPQNSAELIHRADEYLYKAKKNGRNRVEGKVVE